MFWLKDKEIISQFNSLILRSENDHSHLREVIFIVNGKKELTLTGSVSSHDM